MKIHAVIVTYNGAAWSANLFATAAAQLQSSSP